MLLNRNVMRIKWICIYILPVSKQEHNDFIIQMKIHNAFWCIRIETLPESRLNFWLMYFSLRWFLNLIIFRGTKWITPDVISNYPWPLDFILQYSPCKHKSRTLIIYIFKTWSHCESYNVHSHDHFILLYLCVRFCNTQNYANDLQCIFSTLNSTTL